MIQTRVCKECRLEFEGGPRAYYCPTCRAERTRERDRLHKQKLRSGGADIRKLGSIDTCERCSKPYTVEGGLQRFCPECQPIHALAYDRETSLPFYHANKDRINPPRKIKRRKRGNTCSWCKNEFDPINGSTTCSTECKRQLINFKARIYRANMSDKNTILGKRFGRLLVIKEIARKGKERQFLCKCDCNKIIPVLMLSLKSGNTKSCGCLKRDAAQSKVKDLVGQRFGRLVVRERSYDKSYNYNAFWLCDCDCGETRVVSSPDLKNGVAEYCRAKCPLKPKRQKSPSTD